jgi:hypothetical protein
VTPGYQKTHAPISAASSSRWVETGDLEGNRPAEADQAKHNGVSNHFELENQLPGKRTAESWSLGASL